MRSPLRGGRSTAAQRHPGPILHNPLAPLPASQQTGHMLHCPPRLQCWPAGRSTHHHTLVAGPAHDGGEHGTGRIVTGKAGLDLAQQRKQDGRRRRVVEGGWASTAPACCVRPGRAVLLLQARGATQRGQERVAGLV